MNMSSAASLNCLQCGAENLLNSLFCCRCGSRFSPADKQRQDVDFTPDPATETPPPPPPPTRPVSGGSQPIPPSTSTGWEAIWNPMAAFWWSIPFTPAFGAFLHAKNWEAMGDADRALRNYLWGIGIVIGFLVLTFNEGIAPAFPWAYIGALVVWYFQEARPQVDAVAGRSYSKRTWSKPIGVAVVWTVIFRIIQSDASK